MPAPANRETAVHGAHLRRSILDLAPLELDCMNALWSAGEGTVRQIQQIMVATRPRAYTTIMTILDRLAQKGVVAREKSGRAYIYRPNLTAEQARAHAVERIVDGFFDGSSQALAAQLASAPVTNRATPPRIILPAPRTPRAPASPSVSAAQPAAHPEPAAKESAPASSMDAALL
jgi:BlaI family transcriptional regulator, penicillinase repressor